MNINNVIQFPKPSVSRRRSSWTSRLKSIPAVVINVLLTVIALIALGALGAVGWVYGLFQNKTFGGIPVVPEKSDTIGSETMAPRSLSKR